MTPDGTSNAWEVIHAMPGVFFHQHSKPVQRISRRDAENGWCLWTRRPGSLVLPKKMSNSSKPTGQEWWWKISASCIWNAPAAKLQSLRHVLSSILWNKAEYAEFGKWKPTNSLWTFHPLRNRMVGWPRAGWIAAFAASLSSSSFCRILDFSFAREHHGFQTSGNGWKPRARVLEILSSLFSILVLQQRAVPRLLLNPHWLPPTLPTAGRASSSFPNPPSRASAAHEDSHKIWQMDTWWYT